MKKHLALLFIALACVCCHTSKEIKYTNEIMVEYLKDSTVAIVKYDEDDSEYKITCSGVWLDTDLFITAYHCISEDFDKRQIELIGEKVTFLTYKDLGDSVDVKGTPRVGEVLAINPKNDLALVLMPYTGTNTEHQFVKVYKDKVNAGRQINIIGNAAGLGFSYIPGYISGNRNMKGPLKKSMSVLQVSAAVIGGVSGGGVFDFETGQLLGVCSFSAGPGRNLSFFIHKDSIIEFLYSNKLLQNQ